MPTRTKPSDWHKMFTRRPRVTLEWVTEVLPRIEAAASERHRFGTKDWTTFVRSALWRYSNESWRDDRAQLEAAQLRIESRGKRAPTHDLAAALREMFGRPR